MTNARLSRTGRRRQLLKGPASGRARRCARVLLAGLLIVAFAIAITEIATLQALQRAAGYEIGNNNSFSGVYSFLANLRDALGPLAIPAGAIGLAGAGFAYMAGSSLAQRIGMGVVIGMLLVLTGPSIIQ